MMAKRRRSLIPSSVQFWSRRGLMPGILAGYYSETIDRWSTRLGDGMAAQSWRTLGLQKIRRVFG